MKMLLFPLIISLIPLLFLFTCVKIGEYMDRDHMLIIKINNAKKDLDRQIIYINNLDLNYYEKGKNEKNN